MWHELDAPGRRGTDIAQRLHDALLRKLASTSRGVDTLREMGFAGKLERRETPIEVWDLGDRLFLNDGALALYRGIGGADAVVGVMEALPADPNLGSLICDVWVEEALPGTTGDHDQG